MIYSQAFGLCQICQEDTFSHSGDIACTRCAPNHWAPEQAGACFPNDRVGAIMRVEGDFQSFNPEQFKRAIAVAVDAEVDDVVLEGWFPGSVIVYFYIEDPDPNMVDDDDSNIRKLSGNEKQLLLYQWFVTDDMRLEDIPLVMIDYKVYSVRFEQDGSGDVTDNVVTLFAPSTPTKNAIVPDHLNQYGEEVEAYTRESTFYFSITVSSASRTVSASVLPLVFSVLFAALTSLFFF